MYDDIDEIIEKLEEMLETVEALNYEDQFHLALEFGSQFREELRANKED